MTRASLDRLIGSDDPLSVVPTELLPLIPGFVERRYVETQELKELLLKNNYGGIYELGHRLNGLGLGYGFQIITDLGKELEEAATHGNRTKIVEVIKGLSLFVGVMKLRLKAH